jgi:DNA-binding phage protein
MNLKKYVEDKSINLTKFARQCNLSFFKVYRAYKGNKPTLETALTIEQFTKGEVQAKDFLDEKTYQKIYGRAKI